MNGIAAQLPRIIPFNYSLSVSLLFHAVFVVLIGNNIVLNATVPPIISKTEFRVIPKKVPPVPIVTKQEIREVTIEKPLPVKPAVPQPMVHIPMKSVALKETNSVVPFVAATEIKPVAHSPSTASMSYRAQGMHSSSSSIPFASNVQPRQNHAVVSPTRQYVRKSLVQNQGPASFIPKFEIGQPKVSASLGKNDQQTTLVKSTIKSSGTNAPKLFAQGFPAARQAPAKSSSGRSRGNIVASGTTAFASSSAQPKSPTALTDPEVFRGYLNVIQKVIAKAKQYPEEERQAMHTGRVKVAFKILRNGSIEELRVQGKSKYERLNQAALKAVNQVVPFAQFPSKIIEDFIDVVIPFRFELK